MAVPLHSIRGRVAALVAATVLVVAPIAVTPSASALITQSVSVSTTVNGMVDGPAVAGRPTTVGFTLTNRSRSTSLGLFTIVVPRGVQALAKGTVPSLWGEALLPCGVTPHCGALVLVSAIKTAGAIAPGASVTATITLTAPSTPGVMSFPLIGIGNGLFSAASIPTVTVAADGNVTGLPGISLTIAAGNISLPTGLAVARLANGANGPVSLTIGPCVPDATTSCAGVLSAFALIGNFKDASGRPLYSDAAPASVSWTCNEQVCPVPSDFVAGTTTQTRLQVEEFQAHRVYVATRNPDGTFQPFAPASACNGQDGSPIPTGTINPQDTGGAHFCVDVGAISRASQGCSTVCSAWSGALTLPLLFDEDPRFMTT